jgi:hypothetical protein
MKCHCAVVYGEIEIMSWLLLRHCGYYQMLYQMVYDDDMMAQYKKMAVIGGARGAENL